MKITGAAHIYAHGDAQPELSECVGSYVPPLLPVPHLPPHWHLQPLDPLPTLDIPRPLLT